MNRVSLPFVEASSMSIPTVANILFRIDFFGDEIDTIRTFNIEDQLSKDKRDAIEIVPELCCRTEREAVFPPFPG